MPRKTPDQMKKEYESRHAISNLNTEREDNPTDGNGGFTDQRINSGQDQTHGSIRGTTVEQSGTIVNAGSAREQYRGEREYGGTDEFSSGSIDKNSQRYGSVDRRTESETVNVPPVELAPDRIINVATTQEKQRESQRKRRDREKSTGTGQAGQGQQVRAVVVDVLKGAEVEATRKRLRYAIAGMFRAFDDFINLTLRDKPPQPLIIWTGIDDTDIDVLVEARISRAQHSVVEARVVKGIITVYEQFATGLITVPRMWQTYVAWQMYGFELPGADMFPKARRRRNLRVVEKEQANEEKM